MTNTAAIRSSRGRNIRHAGLIFLAALVFSALFASANYLNNTWLSPLFERSLNQTTWGLLQRWYLILFAVVISIWKPKQIGFQIGRIAQYWKMLLVMAILNVGVIAAYLLLTGATPYSGTDMLLNEVVTVPWVEEVVWRGMVFAALQAVLKIYLPEEASTLAALFSGICFGLLHATNALFGYPIAFVLLQTMNATIWGVVYGIARARTGSIYPSIVMHALMNLTVVLI